MVLVIAAATVVKTGEKAACFNENDPEDRGKKTNFHNRKKTKAI